MIEQDSYLSEVLTAVFFGIHSLVIGFVTLEANTLIATQYEIQGIVIGLTGMTALIAHILMQTVGEELFDHILENEETVRCEDCGGIRLDE